MPLPISTVCLVAAVCLAIVGSIPVMVGLLAFAALNESARAVTLIAQQKPSSDTYQIPTRRPTPFRAPEDD